MTILYHDAINQSINVYSVHQPLMIFQEQKAVKRSHRGITGGGGHSVDYGGPETTTPGAWGRGIGRGEGKARRGNRSRQCPGGRRHHNTPTTQHTQINIPAQYPTQV